MNAIETRLYIPMGDMYFDSPIPVGEEPGIVSAIRASLTMLAHHHGDRGSYPVRSSMTDMANLQHKISWRVRSNSP